MLQLFELFLPVLLGFNFLSATYFHVLLEHGGQSVVIFYQAADGFPLFFNFLLQACELVGVADELIDSFEVLSFQEFVLLQRVEADIDQGGMG